jgi:hypothetical protein
MKVGKAAIDASRSEMMDVLRPVIPMYLGKQEQAPYLFKSTRVGAA